MAHYDAEALARALLTGASGQDAAGILSRLGTYLNTAEGQQLLARFAYGGGTAVTETARAALSGNDAALQQGLTALLATPEGAELARQIAAAARGRGGGNG